jgi:hypothetical protein
MNRLYKETMLFKKNPNLSAYFGVFPFFPHPAGRLEGCAS